MKKSEILSRIESLFFERTFSDLSMEEIAGELQMKKASLYYHFESKEAMILEIVTASFGRFRAAFISALEKDPAGMIREIVAFSSGERNLFSVILGKGACRLERVRNEVRVLSESLVRDGSNILSNRFGWNAARSELFLSLLECLSEKRCVEGCGDPLPDALVIEIVERFFDGPKV